ncbi:MAG: iron-containing alcohol dehydrogenase [Oscillospiraceae bacterium]|jgi:alcohol dehydrogenase YqhD (iron-dependent ADH family)|nr:iron-containing alcohol dehydrogenase [Oscillospiraceae bacterium]
MTNFEFLVPTKIIFGQDTENTVGSRVKEYYGGKILLHYGGSSAERSGLLARVRKSLDDAGVEYKELGGVMPNPRLTLVHEGVELCRKEGIGFILAVGGGSAIDSSKAIAMGVPYDGDVWDFYCGNAAPKTALPVATVLTIPAAGSESSPSTVITNELTGRKYGCTNELTRPVFSIMNPVLTYTLPAYQTACGAADIMAHIMERYFTNEQGVDFTDRLCEAGLKTIIVNVPKVLENPGDYASRANVMWAGAVAHNGLFGTGRTEDWASHGIEHELSAMYDIAHGAGLAIIFPAWMRYVMENNVMRVAQFANRVWDVSMNFENPAETALGGIKCLKNFFKSIGLPTSLSEAGIDDSAIAEMAQKCTGNDSFTVGGFAKLTANDVYEIYKLAL